MAKASTSGSDESYGAFAYAYDAALGERYFRAARGLLTKILDAHPVPALTHLDLACGTGLSVPFFERRGFVSTGVDRSLPMLRMAHARVRRRIAGDLRALPVRGTFGVITCMYDSLNHFQDLRPVFRQIRACMSRQSLLIFDMNDPEVYPLIWAPKDPFVADGPGYHLEIATRYDEGKRMGYALVTGHAIVAGVRTEIREEHRQRAHTRRDIERALASAWLEAVRVIDFDPFGESRRIKLVYLCRPLEQGSPC